MNPANPNRPYKPSQLSLGFPAKEPTLDALLVTEANESALAVLGAPQSWPFPVICLLGPPRCGLSVLARAWCQEFEGSYHVAKEFSRLKSRGLAALASGFVAVDDADRVKKSENLLTLINSATAEGGHVLLTSKHHPSQWQTQSADLKSRLMALPVIEIGEPDEKMLKARLESALTYLRLSHVPLFKGKGASEVRPVVIARMANLAFFNGSKVQGRERMDSEKSYIRRVLRERTELEEGAKDVVALPHPRFEALHDYYKAEMLDFGSSEQGPNLASNMLEIVFKNLCFSSSSLEPLTKKVPGSVKVTQLKAMVKQLFKVTSDLYNSLDLN